MAKNYVVSMVLNARENASGPVRRVQGMLNSLRARAAGLSREMGFHRITDGFRRLGQSFAGLRSHISGVGAGLLGLAGIGLGGGLLAWIIHGAGEADEMAKFSRRIGISIEQLQLWQHAANQAAGMTNEGLQTSFRDLTKNIGDAANGMGRARPVFEALGISLRDGQGNVRGLNEILPELQAAFRKIQNPALKTSAAMKLFGESGAKMALLLEQPQSEMDRMFGDMERLGVITTQTATDTEAYNDAMDSFGKSITGVRNGLMGQLMPVLTPLIKRMTDFIASIRPQIVERLGNAISGAAATMMGWFETVNGGASPASKAFESLMQTISDVINTVSGLVDMVGGWKNAAIGMAVFMAGPFIASLVSVGTAIAQLGWIVAANPFVLAAAGIAAAVYLIYDNWDKIVSYFTNKFDAVKTAFKGGFVDGVLSIMKEFNPFVIWYDYATGLLEYLTGFDISGIIKEKIQSMASVLPDWVVDKIGLSVKPETPEPAKPAAVMPPAPQPDLASAANAALDRRGATNQAAMMPPAAPEGKIVIELTGAGADGAQIKQNRSRGISLETTLRRGPSFAGAG
ncbi:phage tail tape measure protein [Thalassospira marina]|uniref:Phage tail tape measure protein n=1 Tax=Thalassospira marina TaxID=2048283 RepID=A0A2N3KJT6_9PROT|nr:phage tail tape measure protein [Thalassospira marina]PKR50766.1 phage tail tape measure protein [Thalassospira marina]